MTVVRDSGNVFFLNPTVMVRFLWQTLDLGDGGRRDAIQVEVLALYIACERVVAAVVVILDSCSSGSGGLKRIAEGR